MFTFRECRRTPRVQVTSPERVPMAGPHRLLNIGRGGFAIESPTRFAMGEEHRFEFTPSPSCSVSLRARAIHSMRVMDSEGAPHYVTGFALSHLEEDMPINDLLLAILDIEDAGSAADNAPMSHESDPRPATVLLGSSDNIH